MKVIGLQAGITRGLASKTTSKNARRNQKLEDAPSTSAAFLQGVAICGGFPLDAGHLEPNHGVVLEQSCKSKGVGEPPPSPPLGWHPRKNAVFDDFAHFDRKNTCFLNIEFCRFWLLLRATLTNIDKSMLGLRQGWGNRAGGAAAGFSGLRPFRRPLLHVGVGACEQSLSIIPVDSS